VAKEKMKNKFFIIVVIMLMAVSLSYLYSRTVIYKPEDKFKEIKRKFCLKEKSITASFELAKDAYLLRIRYVIQKGRRGDILFNGVHIDANIFPYERARGAFKNSYIHLPKDVVKQGDNTIEIAFSGAAPSEIFIVVRNYRKQLGDGIYILFSDSGHLPAGKFFSGIGRFLFVVVLASGIITSLAGRNVSVGRSKFFLYYQRYSLLLFIILLLLFLTGWISANSGYRVVIAPTFFWRLVLIVLAPFCVIYSHMRLEIPSSIRRSVSSFLSKVESFSFTETKFAIRIGVTFCLLIIIVNLWVYWPSFFHLFRHDEWFLFFCSKDEIPNLQFLINHIDWQLRLPHDRLMFRPIHHSMLAVNRVVFDDNYVGPHIITFMKHLLATFCLWWLMWKYDRRWISILFALLFSVLVVSADAVIWPHIDAYIVTTIFTILALIVFRGTVYDEIAALNGFALTGLLLFLNILTTEIAFLMPFIFFFAYWTIFRNRKEEILKQKDRCSWLVLLLPLMLWSVLFSVHLYFVYPDLAMTCQSDVIGLLTPGVNVGRVILVLLSGILFPTFIKISHCDKTYFQVPYAGVLCLIIFIACCIWFRRTLLRRVTKEIIFSMMVIVSVLIIICFTRASYVNALLNHNNMSSHYVYCISALVIFVVYAFVDFNQVLQNGKWGFVLFLILAFLIGDHTLKTHRSAVGIQKHTAPLKKYFDSVKGFVTDHKDEPDFSFKIIDRPPKIEVFPWYHETCIDGLFNRFIDNSKPKYVLEYDYAAERLRCSLYSKSYSSLAGPEVPVRVSPEADYVNSIGMQFRRVLGRGSDFLMGAFEVTQKQWRDVMGFNPGRFRNDNHPVENVSYQMVQEFIQQLNKREGGVSLAYGRRILIFGQLVCA
jgi:hypothetical protein